MHWKNSIPWATCIEISAPIILHLVAIITRIFLNRNLHSNYLRLPNFIFTVNLWFRLFLFYTTYTYICNIYRHWFCSEFGATENVFKPILNKYYIFAGNWDFVSNATMHDVEVWLRFIIFYFMIHLLIYHNIDRIFSFLFLFT